MFLKELYIIHIYGQKNRHLGSITIIPYIHKNETFSLCIYFFEEIIIMNISEI